MTGDRPARVLAIGGSTGTGKSDLSLALAERLAALGVPAEIINADAMQLYRGMDIGTAKVTQEERRRFPHHLFDVLDVTEEASVARYQEEVRRLIREIGDRGAIPLLVGGSGLYLSSVLFDFSFPGTDPGIRSRLEGELEEIGPGALYARLAAVDADAARRIGSSNGRRLVRALEIAELTGDSATGLLPDQSARPESSTIILTVPRERLVRRLDARVESMWRNGLLEEVERLDAEGLRRGITASRAIGYAQALAQLDGAMTEEEAVAETQRLTRRYARRQVSWFRRYEGATVLEAEDPALVDMALAAVRPLIDGVTQP
ncbi:tRNA (adenosine(37)-N6)-dimethylallyltransferase MiaA [Labedella phragmitis]|uniref:tRNA dimethylallyltransferase n=1 Tax=Labedella phragmitis TaxID=2498849 RepID=A0A3S4DDH7_9MICO|nr:tRNA (adenosine(37)-N6)-dimethylallyltransferase MiaA [Labedella phragmitis]RWZ46484.1 tRNA (adenosine(37)-N6)-dimethylallyltransferase MiaA [Labedella phragmitis]